MSLSPSGSGANAPSYAGHAGHPGHPSLANHAIHPNQGSLDPTNTHVYREALPGRTPLNADLDSKKKEEQFKSITHFAKYLFFIAKKIAYEDNHGFRGTTTHQNTNDELKKALVKHLIYKLNKILSSLINFNVLQYNENVNVKQEVEYLCLKNSNITLNKIRLMLSKLENSGTNYRYVLYILLKLHSFDEQNGVQGSSVFVGQASPPGGDNPSVANAVRNVNPSQGTIQPERRENGSPPEGDSHRYAHNRVPTNVGVSQRKEDPYKEEQGSKLVDTNGGRLQQQSGHDGKRYFQATQDRNRHLQPTPPEGQPHNQRTQDGGQFRLSIQGQPGRSDPRSDPPRDPLCEKNFINKSLYATIILNNKFNNLDVEETLLMKDLIYPLQGMSGQYIKYDKADRCFYVCNRKVSIGMHHLVNNISSVGLHFRRIKKIVGVSASEGGATGEDAHSDADDWGDLTDGGDNNHHHDPDERRHSNQPRRKGSLVIDALHQIVREYINEYYKLLSYLESDINEHIHKNTVYVGVKKLQLRLQESYKIMRVLTNVVDESRRSTGCNFLSFLYSKSQTYDYEEQKIYRAILQRCLKPINAILKQWVDNGTLKDKYHETFISTNKNVPSEKVWCYKFCLNSNNIPLFLSVSTAKRILLTGKSVHLLNTFGGEGTHFDEPTGKTNPHQQSERNQSANQLPHRMDLHNMPTDESPPPGEVDVFSIRDVNTYVENIDRYVKKLCMRKNKRLIAMLVNKYGLYEHFKAFRHFLLLVDGDFFETIFDNMKTDLYMDAEELKRHYLNSKLDLCIKSSSLFTSNQRILNKLILDKFQVKRGDIGWDVLVFDFLVEKPLDIIFTQRVRSIYKTINVLLIKLKKIHYELANIWYLFTHLFKIMSVVCYNNVFIYCNIMRNEMFHFIQNLLSYFYYDVIDMNWREFKNVIFNCNDLDRLIHEHYQYISQIQFDLFLGNTVDGGGVQNHPIPPSSVSSSTSSILSDVDSTSDGYLNSSFGSPPPGGATDFVYAPSHLGEPSGKFVPLPGGIPHPSSKNAEASYYTDAVPQTGSTNNRTHNVDSETHLCMYRILDIITRFINLTSALISSVCEGYSEIKQLTDTKKDDRTHTDNDIDYVNNFINTKIIGEKTIRDLKVLLKYYRNYIYKFICLLLSDNKSLCAHSRVSKRDKLNSHRLLAARLDFNLYYVNISKLMDGASPKLNISNQIKMINRGQPTKPQIG
ncbi:Gamma-tubulin complex subunit [Plasmodium coatneyi]|uniref:Gamma-tubulin complex subunit n=1 Tax=Plasmodium coatneyi TaxID=208452 RepID=A0A1B1DXS8_9APIC|nr:Gamma-tubulin complex subunit [Plasmodium coatneyi]ANQ07554.1 Gamma-tubulin complex subunit [Plasmodium coatneyi]